MIPDDLRLALTEKLLRVPGVAGASRAGRDALLSGLPHLFLYRNEEGNARGDVTLLVAQLSEIFGANGEWRLLQLINNALPMVHGAEVGTELIAIRDQLLEVQRGLRPVPVHPAEVAQVHLFDLRKPVCVCIGKLPDVAKTSGFVITTPISRLLRYFCESLKQRGASDGIWGRDQVAAPGAPVVIDPRYTTVAAVASRSDNFRRVLAHKHVLWPIYVDNAADAAALWEQLEGAFNEQLEHHLVITFGMPEGADPPPGMTMLPAPTFTTQDICNWVSAIGKALPWPENKIDWWARLILMNCVGNGENLPVEMVYEQLERHCGLITQYRNPDDLMNALEDLELIGG
jgi:hypothetical protein